MIAEFLKKEDLDGRVPPSMLRIYVRGLLESMVENTLIDGRSRRIDDFFTVRLDMKGTAKSSSTSTIPAVATAKPPTAAASKSSS